MIQEIQSIQRDIDCISNSLDTLAKCKQGTVYNFDCSSGEFFEQNHLAKKWGLNPRRTFGRLVISFRVLYRMDGNLEQGCQILNSYTEEVRGRIVALFDKYLVKQEDGSDLINSFSGLAQKAWLARYKLREQYENPEQEETIKQLGKIITLVEMYVK